MIKKVLYLLIFIGMNSQLMMAQCESDRYKDVIFDNVFVHTDVKYGEAPFWSFPYGATELFADIYEPIGDYIEKRPLMIWVHPGGFLIGNKGVDDMVMLCDTFAQKGYVTASLSYRLGYNPFDAQSSERAVYRGTQDVRAAVRFFIEFADIYEIDTTRIFIGGSSAGGFAALHTAYLDEDERPLSTFGGTLFPDLGCLDCTGNDYQHEVKPLAIIDMWGALGDSTYRDANDTIPVLIMHGTADDVVAYDKGSPFDVGFLPVTHGALPIKNRSDDLGLPYILHTFYGEGHEPHGVSNGDFNGPPTPYWDTILMNTTQFYHSFLEPQTSVIMGLDLVTAGDEEVYQVNLTEGSQYCWSVTGGEIVEENVNTVTILWSQAGMGTISVQELNDIHCSGQLVDFDVTIQINTSINTHTEQRALNLYPNPAKDILILDFESDDTSFELVLKDVVGRTIYQKTQTEKQIKVQPFQAGVYYLTIFQNGERLTQKVIIRH